jgi:hypothetical protein
MKRFSLLMCLSLVLVGHVQAKAAVAKSEKEAQKSLTLVRDGKSSSVIVVAADAIATEKTAALQLQKYLLEVTGTTLEVKAENEVKPEVAQILVGAGPRVKALLPHQNWQVLGKDGIVIKSVGNKLILAGGRPRGSIYAVFEFLEAAVGCRWWAPDAQSIPHKKTLVIKPQNVSYVSPFVYREHYASSVYADAQFATKMRENGWGPAIPADWGGHYSFIGWCHTFTALLLPLDTYFKDHPEWYTDPNNVSKPCTAASVMPRGQSTQLCLSNPQVVDELSKRALECIRREPEAGYISISQNDSDYYCTCPECDKLMKEEGSYSGPLVKFVNEVAARINREYPDFMVETLAYRGSVVPPKTIRPKGNVLIRLAPITADYGHPLDSDWNAKTRDNLKGWAKISPHMFVWNYVVNYNHTLLPVPNWDGQGKDLQFFAASNVQGVFQQGNDYTNNTGDFAPLRVWLLSKLMWNPQLNQTKLRDEFLRGYYEAASPYLKEYLDMTQKAFLKRKSANLISSKDLSYLGLAEMNRGTRLFQQALDAVKSDEILMQRVQREKLSFDLVWLLRYRALRVVATKTGQEFLGPKDGPIAVNQFFDKAKGFGIKLWGEGTPLDSQRMMLEGQVDPAAPLPEFATKFPEENVVDIQDRAISLRAEPVSRYEDDPLASDGKAVSTRGDSVEWALQADLNQGLSSVNSENWHVYAMVRAELKPGAGAKGLGLDAGIFDDTHNIRIGEKTFPLEGLGTTEYRPIDLGVFPLTKYGFVWFASKLNPAVEKFYVDRLILVREPDDKPLTK